LRKGTKQVAEAPSAARAWTRRRYWPAGVFVPVRERPFHHTVLMPASSFWAERMPISRPARFKTVACTSAAAVRLRVMATTSLRVGAAEAVTVRALPVATWPVGGRIFSAPLVAQPLTAEPS